MKVFIYKAQSNGKGRIEASVFRVKRNMSIYLGTISYNCAASKGGESEVLAFLCNNGHIPKKIYNLSRNEWRDEGYYCKEVVDAGYKIIRII